MFAWRRSDERQARGERALRVVTSSDVVALHLSLVDGAAALADAHGQYRAEPGGDLVVLTTRHLPPIAGGERYVAWIAHGPRWHALGAVEIGSDGSSLTVFEDPAVMVARSRAIGKTGLAMPCEMARRCLTSTAHLDRVRARSARTAALPYPLRGPVLDVRRRREQIRVRGRTVNPQPASVPGPTPEAQ